MRSQKDFLMTELNIKKHTLAFLAKTLTLFCSLWEVGYKCIVKYPSILETPCWIRCQPSALNEIYLQHKSRAQIKNFLPEWHSQYSHKFIFLQFCKKLNSGGPSVQTPETKTRLNNTWCLAVKDSAIAPEIEQFYQVCEFRSSELSGWM